jgi:hypothetical protein
MESSDRSKLIFGPKVILTERMLITLIFCIWAFVVLCR